MKNDNMNKTRIVETVEVKRLLLDSLRFSYDVITILAKCLWIQCLYQLYNATSTLNGERGGGGGGGSEHYTQNRLSFHGF